MNFIRTLVLAALVLLALPVRAQTPGEQARAAYDAGSSEYDLGHYRSALSDFEKAFRIRHIPALLFNIAQCHRMLGEMKDAATVYRSFIAKDPQNARVPQASTLLAQVEAALDKQTEAQRARPTEVAAPPQGKPGQTGSGLVLPSEPQPAPPGVPPLATAKALVAAASQHAGAASEAKGAPQSSGSSPTEEIALAAPSRPERAIIPASRPAPASSSLVAGRAPAASPAPGASALDMRLARPPDAPASRHRVFTWIALGGAAVAAGVGLGFGARSKSTQSSLSGQLHSGADVPGLQDGEIADAHRANALFIAAGVLAAASAAFFVLEF